MASSGHVAFYPAFAQIEGRGVGVICKQYSWYNFRRAQEHQKGVWYLEIILNFIFFLNKESFCLYGKYKEGGWGSALNVKFSQNFSIENWPGILDQDDQENWPTEGDPLINRYLVLMSVFQNG